MSVEGLQWAAVAFLDPPHMEKVGEGLDRDSIEFKKKVRKLIDEKGRYDVGVLGHEGGHSKVHGKLGKLYSAAVIGSGRLAHMKLPVMTGAIGHVGKGGFKATESMSPKERAKRRRIGAAVDVGMHAPQLADELAATLIGLKDLKKGKIGKEQYKAIRKRLAHAYGTYASGPGAKALAHGANEVYALTGEPGKDRGLSPVIPSMIGSIAGMGGTGYFGAKMRRSPGALVSKKELGNWAGKMGIKSPIVHSKGDAAHYNPMTERPYINIPDERLRR